MLFKSIIIVIFVLLALLAINGMRVRELAVLASKRHCQQLGLQLLDQSVSLMSTRPHRTKSGQLGIKRVYRFEFTSTGDERYKGSIAMHNQVRHDIHLEPHRMPDSE